MGRNGLPGGAVLDSASDQNFRALDADDKALEAKLAALEAEGLPPSGKAGGVLKGTYPNPEFAKEPAYKAELENEEAARKEGDATEKAAREAADKAEKEAREAADGAEKSAREAADSAEKSAREAADALRVVGPVSATDNTIVVYDGITGKLVKMPSTTLSANSKKIANVLTPTEALDAANKEYVDTAASAAAAGLSIKNPVAFASTAALTVTKATEKTLEGKVPLTIDGNSTWAKGTRVLLKSQAAEARNGIYEATLVEGVGGTGEVGGEGKVGEGEKWLLTRTADADTTPEVVQGMYVPVTKGTTNAGTAWTLATENPIVIGTTAQSFSPYTATPGGAAGGDLEGTYPNPTLRPALRAQIACRLATQASLAAYTRTENVITANANGALANIDGVAAAVGDYVLLKNGAAGADNGIYRVAGLGSAGSKWSLERASEMNLSAEYIPGMLITIAEGAKNLDRVYQLTTNGAITLNTTELAFALVQPENWGRVEALPTAGALPNDTCVYVANKTAGVYWEFVCDEEGEFPWKYAGGPPLYSEVEASQLTASETFVALGTAGPEVTVPLKGDYDVAIGARILNSASGGSSLMSYSIGATAAVTADALDHATSTVVNLTTHQQRLKRKTGLAASTALVAKYRRASAGNATFQYRWMAVTPVRVG